MRDAAGGHYLRGRRSVASSAGVAGVPAALLGLFDCFIVTFSFRDFPLVDLHTQHAIYVSFARAVLPTSYTVDISQVLSIHPFITPPRA